MTTTEALGEWGPSTATTPSVVRLRSASWARCTRSPSPTDTTRGSWSATTRHEARSTTRLSKDMLAALATGGGVVAEGCRDRRSPGTCSASTRRITADCAARLGRLHARVEELRTPVQAMVDDLLDAMAAAGPGAGRSRRRVRVPAAVHRHLRAARRARAGSGGLGRGLTALLVPPRPRPSTRGPRRHPTTPSSAMLEALVEAKQGHPGDDLVSGLISARDGDGAPQHPGARHDLPAHRGRPRHDGEPHRQQCRRPARIEQLDGLRSDPGKLGAAIEELLRYDARSPLDLPLRRRPVGHRWSDDPRGGSGHHLLGGGQPGPRTLRQRRTSSSSSEPRAATSPSDTGSTTASVRRSPGWRVSWPSGRCCVGSPSSAWRCRMTSCTGVTATASCFVASRTAGRPRPCPSEDMTSHGIIPRLDALGAVVTDVGLTSLGDGGTRSRRAFHERGAGVPGQHPSSTEQMAFAAPVRGDRGAVRRLRPRSPSPPSTTPAMSWRDHPVMQVVRGNQGWHTDSSCMPVSAKASMLSARVVPTTGG